MDISSSKNKVKCALKVSKRFDDPAKEVVEK